MPVATPKIAVSERGQRFMGASCVRKKCRQRTRPSVRQQFLAFGLRASNTTPASRFVEGRAMSERTNNRREFAKKCAAVAAAPLLGGLVIAEEPPKPKPVLPVTVDAMMEIARASYGKYLSEDQLKEVQRGIGQ